MILAEMCPFGKVLAELEFWMGCFAHDITRLGEPRVSSDSQVLSSSTSNCPSAFAQGSEKCI